MKEIILFRFFLILGAYGAKIHRYDAPLVTIKLGNAWIINGNLNLVHVINIDDYASAADTITASVNKYIPPGDNRQILLHYLSQVADHLNELRNTHKRMPRSVDWIGSAWKWIAGNPDAADWDNIIKSQNEIISANNEQYKINKNLQSTTNEMVHKVNDLIARVDNAASDRNSHEIEQNAINHVIILRNEINDIIRACQMAKSGIVNTNLLDQAEVKRLIEELQSLPYENTVEAIEYGTPSVYTNGTLLLYVISMPKIGGDVYHLLATRSAIHDERQIDFDFDKIIINEREAFGIEKDCLSIGNSTICRKSSLSQLADDGCIPRILRGGDAKCRYRIKKDQIVEAITEDTIYLTNYKGQVEHDDVTDFLNGTYLIQLYNESVRIDNYTYSSTSASKTQALPPVLANVTTRDLAVNIEYIHEISLRNIKELQHLATRVNNSFGSGLGAILLISICVGVIFYKITRKLHLPNIVLHPQHAVTNQSICGTQMLEGGGVTNGEP